MSAFLNAIVVLGLMLIWLLSAGEADAYDSGWCDTYADEAITVLRITDPDAATATPEALGLMRSRIWARCLNSDAPPSLAFSVALEGAVPAAGPAKDADRIAACRKAYRTFRESDMTVIRRGGKGKRVPCPL